MTVELVSRPNIDLDDHPLSVGGDRRADIEAKVVRTGELLRDVGCEGLLLLQPENLAWLTSGATHRSLPDPTSSPAIYCNGEQRWLIASNADSQRIFDEELDGLGFQLKEWPWHGNRDVLLQELCQSRKVACDTAFNGCEVVSTALGQLRRLMSPYEQACMAVLGQVVSHALEATCRSFTAGDSERELAGQIGHRLMRRGVHPMHIGVAADGRSRLYRNFSYTSTPARRYAVVTATGRKYGLSATASRVVCFGAPESDLREAHNAVCRVAASYLASTWPHGVPREILLAGRRIYQISGFEHEWMLCPQGHLISRLPVELPFTPQAIEVLDTGNTVVWNVTAGPSSSCDTFLVTDNGPRTLTPTEAWPLKRIRIQGAELIRPDILER